MRKPDWVARLNQTLRECERTPFRWGSQDCCIFAARCIDAMTGQKLTEQLRALYADPRGAARLIRERGGFEATVSSFLGDPTAGQCASRGDICQVDKHAVGVCTGTKVRVLDAEGQHSVDLAEVRRFWRVP